MSRLSRQFYLAIAMTLACVAVRSLIPVGYMPGNLLLGETVAMCPVASEGPLRLINWRQPNADRADNHGQHDDRDRSGDETCPIGNALLAAAVSSEPLPQIVIPTGNSQPGYGNETGYFPQLVRRYLTRAPPHV
jgi:hypothetical protein